MACFSLIELTVYKRQAWISYITGYVIPARSRRLLHATRISTDLPSHHTDRETRAKMPPRNR